MDYSKQTYFFDYDSPEIQDILSNVQANRSSEKEIAIELYNTIRDNWRYNPYSLSFSQKGYKASTIAKKSDGHCIDKSILLITCLRAFNIPARLHLAKVKNHIGVERLIEKFGKNEITPHGMVDVYLNNKWIKVSPAFNTELCIKCNVAPTDFDGENDAIFHPFDISGNKFMEYIEDYGHFGDVPVDFIFENFMTNYPLIYEKYKGQLEFTI